MNSSWQCEHLGCDKEHPRQAERMICLSDQTILAVCDLCWHTLVGQVLDDLLTPIRKLDRIRWI